MALKFFEDTFISCLHPSATYIQYVTIRAGETLFVHDDMCCSVTTIMRGCDVTTRAAPPTIPEDTRTRSTRTNIIPCHLMLGFDL